MGVRLKVWGEFACFTRPESGGERVSYDVLTPSAGCGILEAIYWKPEIRWEVTRIRVLRPVRFTTFRRNEVGRGISEKVARSVMRGGNDQLWGDVSADRQQRSSRILRDVAYVIEARLEIRGGADNAGKHLDQFNRRAAAGRCFHRPYLGCREFWADFEPGDEGAASTETPDELRGERDLGFMFRGYDEQMTATFFRATMRDGVVDVPPRAARGVRA